MVDDLERVQRFEREVEMAGTEAVDSPLGVGVLTPELPLRHDSNYLLVDRAENAAETIAEADRILGGAEIAHRVILAFDERLGERLRPEFEALGWRTQCHIFMVQRREPEKTANLSIVKEVDESALRPGRTREILGYPWGTPELAQQLLDAKLLLTDRAETRFFGAEVDGEIVSWTDLYVAQGVGQIEDVATLPEHRSKGYATAVVLRGIEEARRAHADLVFLVADDEDWPKELYRRLGFDIVGRQHKFIRP
ncbi:MAG: GNAT family N-acetyltransferase [Chloroflexota bacterium]|nr:GNAT family N-acetyltransferase [Chloroflexota bacterium]